LVSDGEYSFSDTIEEHGYIFFKEPDLTRPFCGNDLVDIDTIIYTTYP